MSLTNAEWSEVKIGDKLFVDTIDFTRRCSCLGVSMSGMAMVNKWTKVYKEIREVEQSGYRINAHGNSERYVECKFKVVRVKYVDNHGYSRFAILSKEDVSLNDLSSADVIRPDWWDNDKNPYHRRNGRQNCTAYIHNGTSDLDWYIRNRVCFGDLQELWCNVRGEDYEDLFILYDCNPLNGVIEEGDTIHPGFGGQRRLIYPKTTVIDDNLYRKYLKLLVQYQYIPDTFDVNRAVDDHEAVFPFDTQINTANQMFWWMLNVRYGVEQPRMVWTMVDLYENHGYSFDVAYAASHFNHVSYDCEHNSLAPITYTSWEAFERERRKSLNNINTWGVEDCNRSSEGTRKVTTYPIIESALMVRSFIDYFLDATIGVSQDSLKRGNTPISMQRNWDLQSTLCWRYNWVRPIVDEYKDSYDYSDLSSFNTSDYNIYELCDKEVGLNARS